MQYDLIIIGGGPAALTAAIYAGRKLLKTLVLAKELGGQAARAVGVENYPGISKINGVELIFNMEDKAKKTGAEIVTNCEVAKIISKNKNFLLQTNKGNFEGKTIIIASGKVPRKLNIPGEQELTGHGVAYCATCDAPLFKNKIVIVVGGGNAALQSARELSRYAKEIILMERGKEFAGDALTIQDLKKDSKIIFETQAELLEINGSKSVESVKCKINNKIKNIKTDGVFVEIGSVPSSDFTPADLKKNSIGEIIINHQNKSTNIPGIFAAGDVTNSLYKQIIIASGEGAAAALSVYEYLSEKR